MVIDVCQACAHATVASAVEVAIDGDTVRILDPGPYVETVVVAVSLTIEPGVGVQPVLVPITTDGFLAILQGATVTVRGMEFDGLGVGRVARVYTGQLVLEGVLVHDTFAKEAGAAVLVEADPANALVVTGSSFSHSVLEGGANNDGGMIAVLGGTLTLQASTFVDGSSEDDGGLVAFGGSAMSVEGCVFEEGVAEARGGAIHLAAGAVEIRQSEFANNESRSTGGGALSTDATGSLLVEESLFRRNRTIGDADGGAFMHSAGDGTIRSCVFCLNVAGDNGGAISLEAGELVVENTAFLENVAEVDDGGALHVAAGRMDLVHASLVLDEGQDGVAAASWVTGGLVVRDTYVADHGPESFAVWTDVPGGASVASSAFWRNAGGDWNGTTVDLGSNVTTDSLVPRPTAGACDVLELVPPPDSPLSGAASDGTDIGIDLTGYDLDGDGWPFEEDCDERDEERHPGQAEACDGVDQDCDALVDEDAIDAIEVWTDADGDTFGAGEALPACGVGDGLAAVPGDCDDGDATVFPGATDLRDDGVDQDCDGGDYATRLDGAVGLACGCRAGGGTGLALLAATFIRRARAGPRRTQASSIARPLLRSG